MTSMVRTSLVLLLLINAAMCCTKQQISDLEQALSTICDPPNDLFIIYNLTNTVKCAGPWSHDSVQKQPFLSFSSAQQDMTYSLLMLTAGAPCVGFSDWTFFISWVVTDIKGFELKNIAEANKNNIVYEYYLPETCGSLRYYFVLLREDNGPAIINPNRRRSGFGLLEFLSESMMCDSIVATTEIVVSA